MTSTLKNNIKLAAKAAGKLGYELIKIRSANNTHAMLTLSPIKGGRAICVCVSGKKNVIHLIKKDITRSHFKFNHAA